MHNWQKHNHAHYMPQNLYQHQRQIVKPVSSLNVCIFAIIQWSVLVSREAFVPGTSLNIRDILEPRIHPHRLICNEIRVGDSKEKMS